MADGEALGEAVTAAVEGAAAQTAAVVEHAAEAIDQANERAEDIARAAMETELGRRIAAQEARGIEWQGQLESLTAQIQAMSQQLASLAQTIQEIRDHPALIVVQPPTPGSPANPSELTPPQSTEEQAAEILEVIAEVPPKAALSAVVENPVPRTAQKRIRLL